MKNTNKKVIATAMAAIMTISAFGTASAISTSALSTQGTAQAHASQKAETPQTLASTSKLNTLAKTYVFTCKGQTKQGYDWDYTANNNNIKVKCEYNFKTHTYKFKFTGKAKGATQMNFKYRANDKTWVKVPMNFKVDAQKNIMRTK